MSCSRGPEVAVKATRSRGSADPSFATLLLTQLDVHLSGRQAVQDGIGMFDDRLLRTFQEVVLQAFATQKGYQPPPQVSLALGLLQVGRKGPSLA